MVSFIRSDLDFILLQIMIAEAHAAGQPLSEILPNNQVPWGLRTIDGSFNNLLNPEFGAADTTFPRLVPASLDAAEAGTSYTQTSGLVIDSEPRTISNLIVDQTANNPAAVAAAAQNDGSATVLSPGLDGVFGTADDTPVFFIPNVTPDAGLTVPFNAWMTFFGQFFDHGLDLVTKGGSGTVFIPLNADDPLYDLGADGVVSADDGTGADGLAGTADDSPNFMLLTRARNLPGADGILGTADDIHEHTNTTSPFIDQNQTYASHPAHQVFLRAYTLDASGRPVATGRLITNRDLGADGTFGTGDDVELGGMATWAVVKAQARDILGIELTDADVGNVPLLATDPYGNFIKGPNGFPQVVIRTGNGADGIAGTDDDNTILVEGNPSSPVNLANAVRTGHAFLDDIAHAAAPKFAAGGGADGIPKTADDLLPDSDSVTGLSEPGTYDDELLDAHYIAGDGRVNENIGLTAVHSIFHSEHNRLVEHTKEVVLASGDLAFLTQWLAPGTAPASFPATPAEVAALQWNGERLFQAAKFGTEMQYQHLVFEEFARTIQPNIDEFLAPNGYDTTIDASIVAEFAHTVYRFGHSMLTETIDRLDPNFNNSEIGLIAAFLNPLAFAASGPTPEEAVGAIARGVTRQVGNEIDEFVTEALRNNLVGLPLDLATINIARGRDTGVPTLNEARAQFYAATGDQQLKPYASWAELVQHLRHPESIINFIAAYGTHASILAATTLDEKRAAATLLVLGGVGEPADRLEFLNGPAAATGVNDIDFWIGGLAEKQMPFGGLLGSTFNFVFETQLEALQNADRFYYLSRTAGLNFGTELENNSFSDLVMRHTDATHLPANIFQTPAYILEVDQSRQFTGLGVDGRADPNNGIVINGQQIIDEVIRDNPDTVGPDTNYLHYTGVETVVLGGTAGNDILIAGDSDDDTIYGDAGNDRIDGGYGDDVLHGGPGDDIITDRGGDDTIHGEDGHDVIQAGNMAGGGAGNLILGGAGQDFIFTTEDISTIFGGTGNDFIYGAKTNLPPTGNEGDDWIERGTQDGAPGDNFSPLMADDVVGHDIFIGGPGFDEMIGEGGDDIFTGSDAQDKMDGNSGFDWVTYKNDLYGVTVDLGLAAFAQPHGNTPNANTGVVMPIAASPASLFDRFAEVEGVSGSKFADVIYGDNRDATAIAGVTATTNALTNLDLITGLRAFIEEAFGPGATGFDTGNILMGGQGSDLIMGRGGDDLIDGDRWLNVRISVRAGFNANGPLGGEIATFDTMSDPVLLQNMLNGTWNPGQLLAVREIKDDDNAYDTAVFAGNRNEYEISTTAGVTTVAHRLLDRNGVIIAGSVGADGIDTLVNIERLQFNDIAVNLVGGNALPTGELEIRDALTNAVDTTPTEGQLLRVNPGTLADANGGINTASISYIWQAETAAGSGIFEDIILINGGDLAFQSATGSTFRVTADVAGLAIRVKAIFQDGSGVTEIGFSAVTAPVEALPVVPPVAPAPGPAAPINTGPGVFLAVSDLTFLLDQIRIAEAHAAGQQSLIDLLPNVRSSAGLRTVTGEFNNLLHPEFGAADNVFPRISDPSFRPAEGGTSYASTGFVLDSEPRTISNLIVDQTASNPAAVAAASQNDGAETVLSPGRDGLFGTADDHEVFFIPNVTPDAGLTAPFNAWMTFFGQFFDHGLDLVTKGGNSVVFMPLKPDDPLYDFGADGIVSADDGFGADGIQNTADDSPNFMLLTRATQVEGPGADGILVDNPLTAVNEAADNTFHEAENTTSPFVDQNQTYSSHPSHQVFLRAYEATPNGPVATGRLITNRGLGADGEYGTSDDSEIGGMATWAVVKAQARDILGINLTDADVDNVPLLATDDYGSFVRGPNGFPMVVFPGSVLVEGDPTANGGLGIDITGAIGTGHAFLNDIAHTAAPKFTAGPGADGIAGTADDLAPDSDTVAGNAPPAGTYDNELLDAHYIAGDGRVNENIGLIAVHAIFHSEHNRLVEQIKNTVLTSGNLAFVNEWLRTDVATLPTTPAEIAALQWDGERLFQAAKFGTEMQYQHLVFEEFARTIQPNIDLFFAPTQVYDVDLDASIVAEFAHTVYRFGHSMLTETVDRFDPNFNPITVDPLHPTNDQQLGLIAAFLNPLAYAASGATPEDATGAIVRGVTRQVGNEIDEFVTEALRNNLVGLPLDLAAINIARGRDTGVPTLNEFRRDIYTQTGDSQLKPYSSWADLVLSLRHPESVINFIAAYGRHEALTAADVDTLAEKRAVATALVLGGTATINAGTPEERTFDANAVGVNRFDFLNSTGAWANTAGGVTITGVDDIDFWIGGLAEEQMPFGGMLGSTFNFVFENQLEKLQDGDRFYYLERTAGLAFNAELEGNSFARLIMANSNVTHLPALVFQTPAYILEVDQSRQFNAGLGNADPTNGILLTPEVIRDNPDTIGPDTNYLRYAGAETVVLGGTEGNDILIAGDSDDDTVWGDGGDDRIDGGYGADNLRGGAGNDIITDLGGDDNIQGGDGDDVIHGGNGINLIMGGAGSDFIVTGEDSSEAMGGQGNDFILGSKANEQDMGNEGDDWIEGGTSDGAPGDNFDPLGLDLIIGNDVFVGRGENDKFNAEGGDDIMVGSAGMGDRYIGASGYDWATFKDDERGIYLDVMDRFFDQPPVPGSGASVLTRFDWVEGFSGSQHADVIRGDNVDAAMIRSAGAQGSILTNIGLIDGLQEFLDIGRATPATFFDGGNIILGGGGGDILEGRGGDDLIDGDLWLNVRISVRDLNDPSLEIASFDSMVPMIQLMINGTYTPGQLTIVRELLTSSDGGFDTAVYSGNLTDYDIGVDDRGTADTSDDIITVTDLRVGRNDGSDRLTHIERLHFSDVSVTVAGTNNEPLGFPTIIDAATGLPEDTPQSGQLLRVSINGIFPVTDADNPGDGSITGLVDFFWQFEKNPGSGVFEDLTTFAAGEVARIAGPQLLITDDLNGLSLRVKVIYRDANGTLEVLYSNPTAPAGPPAAPVIESDPAFVVEENTTAVGTVVATDANIGDVVTFALDGGADAGLFTIDSVTGDLSFLAAPDFEAPADQGADNVYDVVVRASDGTLSVTQAITVTVTGVNEPPVALDDGGFTVNEDGSLVVTADVGVLANDNDPDGDAVSAVLGAGPLNGTVILNADGSFTYTPDANFNGTDTFTYVASDGTETSNVATVTITVNPVNDAPVAPADVTGTTLEDTDLVFTAVEFGFSDPDDIPSNSLAGIFIDTLPAAGVLRNNGAAITAPVFIPIAAILAGELVFSPNPDENGVGYAEFTFRVQDDGGTDLGGADTAVEASTFTIDVTPVNDLPIGEAFLTNPNAIGPTEGQVLVATNSITDVDVPNAAAGELPVSYTWESSADGLSWTEIAGATGDTFTLTQAEVGLEVRAIANYIDVAGEAPLRFVSNSSGGVGDLINGTNASQTSTGTAFADIINGNGGNDRLIGLAGIDILNGGAGQDTLDGGEGADVLVGGTGDDTYIIDDTGDVAIERGGRGGGTDTVITTLSSFTLGANLENLTLSGPDAISGTGNGLDNIMRASSAGSTLSGLGGADTLIGGGGSDTLLGGGGADSLSGDGGADRIVGGTGRDTLTGGGGSDTFVFEPGFGRDVITDFDAVAAGGQDFIDIQAFGFDTAAVANQHVDIFGIGGATLVVIDNTFTIRLNGVNANTVTFADFIL